MEPRPSRALDDPAWVLLVLGWSAAAAALHLGWLRGPSVAAAPPRGGGRDLETLSPRDLRRLPGIGEVKALALASDRWRRRSTGAPLVLEDLPGIGPKTAGLVREALGGGPLPPRGLHSPQPPAPTRAGRTP